jgi:tripartite-type tricarboxylate transporter receptor subunit TctC
MQTTRIAGGFVAAALMLAALPQTVGAQEAFPSRTVKIVVPSAAGSTTDSLARILAEHLQKRWNGNSVVVENVAGAAMNLGSRGVYRSAPDGYTLMVAPPAPLSFNHVLYKDLGYEPTKWTPITMLAKIPNVMVVANKVPAKTLAEFIAHAKANPGKLNYASSGVGSTAHLTAALLEVRAGIKMVHVPYRGAIPALTDVVAGHVDLFFDTVATGVPQFKDGKVKILGIGDTVRTPAAPEIPTMAEAGLPGFRSTTWFGLVAPPGTPDAIADKLNADTVALLKSAEVVALLGKLSLDPGATSRADTLKFFADEAAQWVNVIKEAGIPPQ